MNTKAMTPSPHTPPLPNYLPTRTFAHPPPPPLIPPPASTPPFPIGTMLWVVFAVVSVFLLVVTVAWVLRRKRIYNLKKVKDAVQVTEKESLKVVVHC